MEPRKRVRLKSPNSNQVHRDVDENVDQYIKRLESSVFDLPERDFYRLQTKLFACIDKVFSTSKIQLKSLKLYFLKEFIKKELEHREPSSSLCVKLRVKF